MPNQPATFNKTVRIAEHLWKLAGEVAAAQGTNRATVINQFLECYVGIPGAELPPFAETRKTLSD